MMGWWKQLCGFCGKVTLIPAVHFRWNSPKTKIAATLGINLASSDVLFRICRCLKSLRALMNVKTWLWTQKVGLVFSLNLCLFPFPFLKYLPFRAHIHIAPLTAAFKMINGCVWTALRDDLYFEVGSLLALSLVHGGPPVGFFSPALYHSLFNYPTNYRPTLQDLGDTAFAHKIRQVSLVFLDIVLQNCCCIELCDYSEPNGGCTSDKF